MFISPDTGQRHLVSLQWSSPRGVAASTSRSGPTTRGDHILLAEVCCAFAGSAPRAVGRTISSTACCWFLFIISCPRQSWGSLLELGRDAMDLALSGRSPSSRGKPGVGLGREDRPRCCGRGALNGDRARRANLLATLQTRSKRAGGARNRWPRRSIATRRTPRRSSRGGALRPTGC